MFELRKRCLYLLPTAFILLGLSLHNIGTSYTRYSDPSILERLNHGDTISIDEYEKYSTCHDHLVNFGDGLTSLGLSILCLFIFFRINSLSDLANLKSPRSKFAYLILLNIVLIFSGPAFLIEQARPPNMELNNSDGPAIFAGVVIFSVISFITTNILAGFALYFAKLPAYCFKPNFLKTSSRIIGIVLIGWLSIEAFSLLFYVRGGNIYMVPLTLLKLYLLSSIWGGLINPSQIRTKLESE